MLNLMKAIALAASYNATCAKLCSKEAFMTWFLNDDRWDEGFVSWQEIAYAASQKFPF